jgi:Holliday junction resolvase RusA-like endonuclease
LPILKEGPVKVKVYFCRVPPISNFINKDRTQPKGIIKAVQDGLASVPYVTIKPDTDNCVKFVLDGMSKAVWTDDAQVAQIIAYKCLDCHPPYQGRTVIEVSNKLDVIEMPPWSVHLK